MPRRIKVRIIATLKESGIKLENKLIDLILTISQSDILFAKKIIDNMLKIVNQTEDHHGVNTEYLTIHPYLKGFNTWRKKTGNKGKAVLFRSYHEPYG